MLEKIKRFLMNWHLRGEAALELADGVICLSCRDSRNHLALFVFFDRIKWEAWDYKLWGAHEIAPPLLAEKGVGVISHKTISPAPNQDELITLAKIWLTSEDFAWHQKPLEKAQLQYLLTSVRYWTIK